MSSEELFPFILRYFEHDVASAANSLELLDEERALEIIRQLPVDLSIQTIKHLQISFAAAILKKAEPELFKSIISTLETVSAATIIANIPVSSRQRLFENIPEKIKQQIREALTYPEDSIGRIMSPEFISFNHHMKVSTAIEKIRALVKKGFPASYVYVINDQDTLVGVMNMRDLMLANSEEVLEHVMRKDIFTLNGFITREEAANQLSKGKYFAVPVVDSQNHILGIIAAGQVLQDIQEEITEDFQRIFGAGADETTYSSIFFSIKKRLPWLHVNLATAFMAAIVVSFFQDIIARITMLAVFLPVIAGQSGNTGAQSLAIVMRGLVMREIPRNRVLKIIAKESWVATLNGIIIGAVTALIAWLWYGNPQFGVIAGVSMLLNLIIAGFSGASIPIIMKTIGLDPAQCSNIILTTVTDVIGFFSFLELATLFTRYLF
ncbi:MAG: magnesium transporter [Chitinivibrionales bacterium]|nr:magnesium transporter [Chitinivibrionales bacterium]